MIIRIEPSDAHEFFNIDVVLGAVGRDRPVFRNVPIAAEHLPAKARGPRLGELHDRHNYLDKQEHNAERQYETITTLRGVVRRLSGCGHESHLAKSSFAQS